MTGLSNLVSGGLNALLYAQQHGRVGILCQLEEVLSGFVYIPLCVVLEVVEFDLREAVMRCGVHLLCRIA